MLATPTSMLLSLAALAAPAHDSTPKHATLDIVATASQAGSFDTLTAAIEAAGLTHTLREGGPFTVFAPTDAAFEALPEGALESLLQPEAKDQLAAILQFHVVSGALDANHVVGQRGLESLAGQRLDVRASEEVRVGGAQVVATDVLCSNGVIHVIDQVLLPAQANLVESAREAGGFQTLLSAVEAAGLAPTLSGADAFTVLAPTDEAFGALSPRSLEVLLDPHNRDALRALLTYHVIPGRQFAEAALAAPSVAPVQGPAYGFELSEGRLRVAGAGVIANDIQASNGVIHAIDSVLFPPGLQLNRGRLVFGWRDQRPSAALAEQLGLDANTCVVVTEVTAGNNAALYGLRPFDVILSLDGEAVANQDLDAFKRQRGFGTSVRFEILRRGERMTLDIPIGIEPH